MCFRNASDKVNNISGAGGERKNKGGNDFQTWLRREDLIVIVCDK